MQLGKAMETQSAVHLQRFLREVGQPPDQVGDKEERPGQTAQPRAPLFCRPLPLLLLLLLLLLRQDKYARILQELEDANASTWRRQGPADEACYATAAVFGPWTWRAQATQIALAADTDSPHGAVPPADAQQCRGTCGPTTRALLDLLCSEDFARYLNQVRLAQGTTRS